MQFDCSVAVSDCRLILSCKSSEESASAVCCYLGLPFIALRIVPNALHAALAVCLRTTVVAILCVVRLPYVAPSVIATIEVLVIDSVNRPPSSFYGPHDPMGVILATIYFDSDVAVVIPTPSDRPSFGSSLATPPNQAPRRFVVQK